MRHDWALVAPRWVEQNELPNLAQLFQELVHGDSRPCSPGLSVKVLEQRDAEHAVKGMDANLASPTFAGRPRFEAERALGRHKWRGINKTFLTLLVVETSR